MEFPTPIGVLSACHNVFGIEQNDEVLGKVGAGLRRSSVHRCQQVKIGSPAAIRLMDGSPDLRGSVEGVARGITDYDNRDGPQLLDSVNPTFTWVRLAQRVPVRIRITNVPPEVVVSAGMTCTVVLKDGAHPQIGASAKRVLAAIRYWFTGETVASAQTSTPHTASRGL